MSDPLGREPLGTLGSLRRHRKLAAIVNELLVALNRRRCRPLFDSGFYLERRPDVARSGVDPLVHYLRHGAAEGADPHPLFDTRYYLERRPDVARSGANPLVHYLRHGAAEGADPHPLFSGRYYLSRYPEVAASGANPLVHFVQRGASEGRDPHPLFASRYYASRNPDVVRAGLNPLVHYVLSGAHEWRRPHPLFDPAHYAAQCRGARPPGGTNALAHYLAQEADRAPDPGPLFDSSFYVRLCPDGVREAGNPLVHFVLKGARDDRAPRPGDAPGPAPAPPEGHGAPIAASLGGWSRAPDRACGVLVAILSGLGPSEAAGVDDPAAVTLSLFAATGYSVFVWLPASKSGVSAAAGGWASRGIDVVVGPGDRVPSSFLERISADVVLLDGTANQATLARVMALQPAARLLLLRPKSGEAADSLVRHFDAVLSAGDGPPGAIHHDVSGRTGETGGPSGVAHRAFVKMLRRTGLGASEAWSARLERSARRAPSLGAIEADLVILGMIPWHYRRQRPQHLSTELGRRGWRVVYVEPDLRTVDPSAPYRFEETPEDNVFCATLCVPPPVDVHRKPLTAEQACALAAGLRALLKAVEASAPVVVLQSPFWYPVCQRLAPSPLVYDCMDLYGAFPNVSPGVASLEGELLRVADLVVFSAAGLLERLPVGRRSAVVRNGCEYARFAAAQPVRRSGRLTVGYAGALDRWLDTDLVNRCAEAFPDWDFELAGSPVGVSPGALRPRSNLTLLGELDYNDVPGLVAGWDVCIIPFAETELTRCVNPVKAYEFLAAGKPVVTTPLPELARLEPGLLHVAAAGDDFVRELGAAAAERHDAALAGRRRAWASRQTWAARAEEFLTLLQMRTGGRCPVPGGPGVPRAFPTEPISGR